MMSDIKKYFKSKSIKSLVSSEKVKEYVYL